MVLLYQIVQVLAGSNLDATRKFAVFLHLSHRPVRGRIGVQRDLRGHASVLHCAAQKRFGGVYVPLPAEKEIDRLARFVDGAVQVYPLPVNLYISLVHPPRSAHGPSVAPPALFEFWKVALHPPQDRCMGHRDPPIRHHDHQIPQAQFEARVPAHAPNDDLSVEVPSSEQILDRDEPLHLFIIARLPRVCTRAYRTTVVIELYRVRCPDCGLKIEKVDQLPSKAPFSKRFEEAVGEACESASARRVAKQFGLAESTVRAIDMRYLERWNAQRTKPALRQMGVDEIFLGKATKFVTVVSNLETGEPLWFGRERKKETLDEFFRTQLSRRQRQRIEAACVDMWEPYKASIQEWSPNCAIVYDKFHIM